MLQKNLLEKKWFTWWFVEVQCMELGGEGGKVKKLLETDETPKVLAAL